MKVFVSNSSAFLANALYETLFDPSFQLLETKWVVIPHLSIKEDLYLHWTGKNSVITGIKVITYSQLLSKLFPQIPSAFELMISIYFAFEEVSLPETVTQYLMTQEEGKKMGLIQEITAIFLSYLTAPEQELLTWLTVDGWQQQIWKKVFQDLLPYRLMSPVRGTFFFYNISHLRAYEYSHLSTLTSYWFLLTPSQMFLGDLKTAKQQKKIVKKAALPAQPQLQLYFAQDPVLLSNYAFSFQQLLSWFDEERWHEEFMTPSTNSALHTLQKEWLFLERMQADCDASIQLHSATSQLREMEVVWEVIHQLGYQGKDVLVLAPDIDAYAAVIHQVFSERKGSFDYTIYDTAAEKTSPFLGGLKLLLSLPQYRFSFDKFQELLVNDAFLNGMQMSLAEGKTLLDWMQKLNLRRDLQGTGSWHFALKKAVESAAICDFHALLSIEWSSISLLNRWIQIVDSLETLLLPLTQQEKKCLADWAVWLQKLITTFFGQDVITQDIQTYLHTLRHLQHIQPVSYEVLAPFLTLIFSQKSKRINPFMGAVTFANLSSSVLRQAEVIILMGMQEGAFPRQERKSFLAELHPFSQVKEDQDAFLRSIVCAKKHLVMTYIRFHPEDGKQVLPSSFIQELVKDRGQITTYHHPPTAYDSSYFDGKSFPSISSHHYTVLQSSFDRQLSPCAPELLMPLNPSFPFMKIGGLRKLAKHPVRYFLEESLNIKRAYPEEPKEFLLPPYVLSAIKKNGQQLPSHEIAAQLQARGDLPCGMFKEAALLSIQQAISQQQEALHAFKIHPEAFLTLKLSRYCQKKTYLKPNYLVVPAISIQLDCQETVCIEGTLQCMTVNGFFFSGSFSIEDLLKIWPDYCIMSYVLEKNDLPLLSMQKQETKPFSLQDPKKSLKLYLEYARKALQRPSPLLPSAGKKLLQGEMSHELSEDDTIAWAEKRGLIPPYQEWILSWTEDLKQVFHELL